MKTLTRLYIVIVTAFLGAGANVASSAPCTVSTRNYTSGGSPYCLGIPLPFTITITRCGTSNSVSCAPTPQPTPKSSSMGLAPPKYKSIYYTSQTTDSTGAVNFNYSDTSKFPPCALDPSSFNDTQVSTGQISTTIQTKTIYPDIEGRPQISGVTSPPDQCVVTSRVRCADNPNTNDPEQTCITSKTITSAIAAVCPDGYAQVGAFDMQPEVAYNATSKTVSSPTQIPDIKTYNYYNSRGYVCNVTSYNQTLNSPCSSAAAGANNSYTFNYARGVVYANPTTGEPGVVKFGSIYSYDGKDGPNNRCYTGAGGIGCSGLKDPSCKLTANSDYPAYGPSTSTISVYLDGGSIDFYTTFAFTYGHVSCTLPSGMYFTNSLAPRKLVCARIKATYDKINK